MLDDPGYGLNADGHGHGAGGGGGRLWGPGGSRGHSLDEGDSPGAAGRRPGLLDDGSLMGDGLTASSASLFVRGCCFGLIMCFLSARIPRLWWGICAVSSRIICLAGRRGSP
jgi:hypothetical protein